MEEIAGVRRLTHLKESWLYDSINIDNTHK